jgi:MFS family permease
MLSTNPAVFFFVFSIGYGLGIGFLYPASLFAGWSHLSGRKGLTSGIIVSGMGIGAFIFGIVAQEIVNP